MRYLTITLLFFLLTAFIGLRQTEKIDEIVKEDLPYLVNLYKKIHQNPEISLNEKETSKALAEELRQLGF